jgi:hypothetical protein
VNGIKDAAFFSKYKSFSSLGSSIYSKETNLSFLKNGEKFLNNFIDDINKEIEEFKK